MSDRTVLRITKELQDIQKSPDQQFQLWYDDKNIKHVHTLITGPPKTPYALGMFDFVFTMGDQYPQAPPKVIAMTTSNGRVRFNPNVYANGKVCLSILGTWEAGHASEKWSAAHGILSVLISIQSLLCEEPYRNEPGHDTEKDPKILADYNAKILHETIRVSICDRLEECLGWKSTEIQLDGVHTITRQFCTCRQTNPFVDITKRMFLMYKNLYDDVIAKEREKITDGTAFVKTNFEFRNNATEGVFMYASLQERLKKLQAALLDEPSNWIKLSPQWLKDETTTASNLKSQFEQIQASKQYDNSLLMELEDGNPFAWDLTVIQLPMTYDGGMFRVQMRFHNDFPEVAPRIRFVSEVFHPHVSKDGVPYFRVARPDNVRDYLDIMAELFMKVPSSDPTTHLNLKAAALYFGTKDEKKDFNRNARRCAQKSVEY